MTEFATLEELKHHIEPALQMKSKQLGIEENKIFNYLSEKKWKKANDLRLFQIIDDIINLDKEEMVKKDETE